MSFLRFLWFLLCTSQFPIRKSFSIVHVSACDVWRKVYSGSVLCAICYLVEFSNVLFFSTRIILFVIFYLTLKLANYNYNYKATLGKFVSSCTENYSSVKRLSVTIEMSGSTKFYISLSILSHQNNIEFSCRKLCK